MLGWISSDTLGTGPGGTYVVPAPDLPAGPHGGLHGKTHNRELLEYACPEKDIQEGMGSTIRMRSALALYEHDPGEPWVRHCALKVVLGKTLVAVGWLAFTYHS